MTFKSINNTLGIFENILASFFLLLTTFLSLFQVINRHIFHFEIMGTGDLMVYSYIFCLYFSLAYATQQNAHTIVEMIPNKIKQSFGLKPYCIYKISLDFITFLITMIFLLPLYYILIKALKRAEWGTLVPWFNQSWLIYCMFISICLCLIHILYTALTRIRDINSREEN